MSADTDRNLSRREALGAFTFAGLVAMFGSSAVAPLARAADAGGPKDGFKASQKVLTPAERAFVTSASGRIIPKTDTPGANEAGVTDYFEMMIADWFNDAERARFQTGQKAMDDYAQANWKKPFAKLKPAQQDAVLIALSAGKVSGAPGDYFNTLRQMTITGYYTSEIGMTVERIYLPVPGDYDGAYDYAKAGRIFNG